MHRVLLHWRTALPIPRLAFARAAQNHLESRSREVAIDQLSSSSRAAGLASALPA